MAAVEGVEERLDGEREVEAGTLLLGPLLSGMEINLKFVFLVWLGPSCSPLLRCPYRSFSWCLLRVRHTLHLIPVAFRLASPHHLT